MSMVVSMACAPDLRAQAQTITFDDAIEIAFERNTRLRASQNELDAQAVAVQSEWGDFLPSLSVSANPSMNWGFTFDQTSLQLVNQTSYFLNTNFGGAMTVFDGWNNVASLRQAQYTYDAASLSHRRTEQDVLYEVVLNFLQVIQDREQIKIQEENLEAQQQLLARIEEFTRVGTRPISDLYQQQAAVAQAELQVLNAERALQLSEARVIQVLKLNPTGEYEFEAPTVDEVELSPEQYELRDLIQNAFEQRADLQAQRARIEASTQGIRATRSGFWPSLNLSGGYGSSYSSADPLDRQFGDQYKDNRGGQLRLGVSVPLFNRFNVKNAVQRAKVQRAQTALNFEDLEQTVALEVRQSYLDYLTAAKQLEVTERQLTAAEQALEAEQERYNVGASTLIELSQVRASFVQAASNRASAVYTFLARKRLIDYYVGVLSSDASVFN